MFGSLRMVAWTMTAIAMLLLFPPVRTRAQESDSNEARDEIRDEAKVAERAVADRFEQIVRSRPQTGTAFDKLYEFHSRQGTLEDLCKRLESSAHQREDGNAFLLLGLVQLRRGLSDNAITNLARAESLLPNEPLAGLYHSRALSAKRQFVPALTALKRASSRSPRQVVALEILKELRQLKDRGIDIEVALSLLSDLEQQFSSSPQVNEKLADCFVEFGRPELAQTIYEKLVDLTRDPLRKIELRMQLARIKKRLGDPEQSLADLQHLVTQVKPQSWLHTTLLEQIEQLTDELHGNEGLIEYYERILKKQPDDVPSMLRLAIVLGHRSRFDEAKTWISRAIELSPSQPEPLLAMADLMEQTNQLTAAAESMQRLVELDPSSGDYIVRWGQLSAREAIANAAPQSNAVAIWRRLLIGHENDPAKAIQLAELLRSISLKNEAVEMYRHALEVSGGKIEYGEMLGEYLLKMDRREEAKKVFEAVFAAAGDDRETLISFSETLTRLKFPAEALRAIEKACEKQAGLGALLQLATLQIQNERFEAAIDTLNRASTQAESSAELTLVWDAQTKAYKHFRQLPERVQTLEKKVLAGEVNSVQSLEQLAIMQSANGQPTEAVTVLLKATLIQPGSMRAWLLTARMQREAGLRLREIESLIALCKLDTKHLVDYLQRIATIHFQLNQVEQALATMEQVFSSSSATLQHFQTAASFCLQAKKPDQAVAVLHRATQVFPRDRSAWVMLARQLAEMKDSTSATEAAWHVLGLSRDQGQKREAVSLLVTLQKSEASMATLIVDLKEYGIANEQENETDLWSAWVMLESDGTLRSNELIANLLKNTNASPESLRAVVELAVRDRDYPQAVAIQRNLIRQEPTAASQLKLGQLLWMAGDAQAAAIEWKNVMRLRTNDLQLTTFAKEMTDKANWTMVADLINVGREMKGMDWEFLSLGIYANIQEKKLGEAANLSDQLLALNLPPAAMKKSSATSEGEENTVPLTAKDRLAWIEHAGAWQALLNEVSATRAGYRTNQSNPRASKAAAVRQLAIQRGASIRSDQLKRFSVNCFAEARALAVLTKYGRLNQQSTGGGSGLGTYIAEAIETKDIEKLWDCVLVLEPSSSRAVLFTSVGGIESPVGRNQATGLYREVLDALVALNEPAAVELAINEVVLRRQLQHQITDRFFGREVPAMDAKDIVRLESLIRRVDADTDGNSGSARFAGQITLAIELTRSQRATESNMVLGNALAGVTDIVKLANCAVQFLSNDRATQQIVSKVLLRALELELLSDSENTDLAFAVSAFRNTTGSDGSKSQEILPAMLQMQALHVEQVSQESIFSDSRSNESRRAYRNFRKPVSVLPDRSSLLSASLRAALIDSASDELKRIVENLTALESLTRTERAVYCFSASIAQAILNDPDSAFELLAEAEDQNFATEIISLYQVWLLVANERYEEARKVLDKIKPPNEAIQRECELWKMELASKLGDRAEALRAARVLEKLPLSVYENADVAAVLNN